ncbi:MAG: flippase [Desulfobaccales bacterium]
MSVFSLVAAGGSFAISAIFARILGAETFGIYTFLLAAVTLGSELSDLGTSQFFMREAAVHPDQEPSILAESLSIRLVAGLATTGIAAGALWFMGWGNLLLKVFWLASPIILLKGVVTVFASSFRVHQRGWIGEIALAVRASLVIVCAGIFYSVMDLKIAVGLQSASWLLALLLTLGLFLKERPIMLRVQPARVWATLRTSFPYALAGIFIFIMVRIDTFMLSKMRGFEEVGLYASAYTIVEGLKLVSVAFGLTLYPLMSVAYAADKSSMTYYYQIGLRWALRLSLGMSLGLMVTAPQVIDVFFGPEYVQAAPAMIVLAGSVVWWYLSDVICFAYRARGMQLFDAKVVGVCAVFNIVANYLVIPRWGIMGAAWSSLITYALPTIFGMVVLFRDHGGPAPLSVLRVGGAGLAMVAVLLLLPNQLMVRVPAGVLIYAGLLLLSREVDRQELQSIWRSLRREPEARAESH